MSATKPPEEIIVVLALPAVCHRCRLVWHETYTVADYVAESGLADVCRRESGEAPAAYGVYGRKVGADHRPLPGMRIELLRTLKIDPRRARRERVARRGE